jgi:sugar lactone lactonase YvrE
MPFLAGKTVSPNQPSTVPPTGPEAGDVNPYGVAVVPASVGSLQQGAVLVSNFNNSSNQQGTGSTITQITPGGEQSIFATISLTSKQACPGGVGLTTALAVFRNGTVVVGSLPTNGTNAGTSAGEQAGCLIVLNSAGKVVRTISGGRIDGPWDLTAAQVGDDGVLFVTNVLNGLSPTDPQTTVVNRGTVVRVVLDLRTSRVDSETVIASGLPERNDPSALVVGPTGVGLGLHGAVLYVASTEDNRITAIPAPFFLQGPRFGPGFTVTSAGSLNAPLGLTVAPNGDIITVNGGNGIAVETVPFGGQQIATAQLDNTPVSGLPNGNGTLFGIALTPNGQGLYFVDDGTNTLNLFS